MYRLKTLAKQNYCIFEEGDSLEEVIASLKENEILGIDHEINSDLLDIHNICYQELHTIDFQSTSLYLKRCKERDAKDVARMINKGMKDVPNTIQYTNKFVSTLIVGEYNEFHYVYDDGICIGLIELCLEEDIPEIQSIVVYEKYRHQGYGKEILKAIDQYLSKEYQEVTIVVSDHNEIAMHLYESNGFIRQKAIMYYYQRRS